MKKNTKAVPWQESCAKINLTTMAHQDVLPFLPEV